MINVEQKLAWDRDLQVDVDLLFSTLQERLFIHLQIQKKEENVIGLNKESCTELCSNNVDGKSDM